MLLSASSAPASEVEITLSRAFKGNLPGFRVLRDF